MYARPNDMYARPNDMYARPNAFITKRNILTETQNGFREGKSTERMIRDFLESFQLLGEISPLCCIEL